MDVDVVIASTFNSPAASPGRDPDADCDALHPGVKEAQEGSVESVGFGRRRFLCLRGFKSESSPSQDRVRGRGSGSGSGWGREASRVDSIRAIAGGEVRWQGEMRWACAWGRRRGAGQL